MLACSFCAKTTMRTKWPFSVLRLASLAMQILGIRTTMSGAINVSDPWHVFTTMKTSKVVDSELGAIYL